MNARNQTLVILDDTKDGHSPAVCRQVPKWDKKLRILVSRSNMSQIILLGKQGGRLPELCWFYLVLVGFFVGQIFAQCTTCRREPFSLKCLILQRDLGEGTKYIPRPNIRTRGWMVLLHLNLALSNTTDGNCFHGKAGRSGAATTSQKGDCALSKQIPTSKQEASKKLPPIF